jgi:hypothetical protein
MAMSVVGLVMYLVMFLLFTSSEFVFGLLVILYVLLNIVLPVIAIEAIRKLAGKAPEIPGESVVMGFIKAKKNKICPMIEYVSQKEK